MQTALDWNGTDLEFMGCSAPMADAELDFVFEVPSGYSPRSSFADDGYETWRKRVERAAARGEIRSELAVKILTSMERMPELTSGQKVSVSFSGGKDSEAIFLLAAMRYPRSSLMSLFADTDDEWPETYTFIDQFEKWIGVPIRRLQSVGIHKLLREMMPYWPRMGTRHCTKNLKMITQRDCLDELGFDQVRGDKRGARYRDSHHGGAAYDVLAPAPITFAGERRAESVGRSKLPLESRDEILLRMTHRPVIDWNIRDVWEFIFWMRAPYNKVYHVVKRAACAGCIFANPKELYALGEYHPDMLVRWVETEAAIGHPWKGKNGSMKAIYDDLVYQGRLGSKAGADLAAA